MMKKMIMAAVTLTMAVSLCGCAGIGRIEQAVRTADFETRTLLAGEETEVNTKNIQAESANRKKGTGKFRGLTFTASCEDAAAVRIQVENDSPDAYSFGWVEGSTLTCVTDEGEYYNTIPNCIVGAGGNTEFNCYFDNAQGEIQTIHISDMHMLNNGLPESFTPSTVDISFTGENSGTDGGESTSEEKNQAAAGSLQGTGNYQGLTIEATGDANRIRVKYTNTGADAYSLGWVNGPTITCVTDQGEYYFAAQSNRIQAGGSLEETYYFDDAAGTLQSLKIDGIQSLSSTGLPMDFSGGASVTITFAN